MSYPTQPAAPGGPPHPAQQPYPPQGGYGYPGQQPYGAPQPPHGAQQPPYLAPPQQPYDPGPPPKPKRTGLKILLSVVAVFGALILIAGGLVVYKVSTREPARPLNNGPGPWETLADGMTKALAAKDEEAFLKAFKGDAVREQQRKVFRNLVKIPWEKASWEPQFAAPLDGVMMVEFAHQVKGVDSKEIAETYGWKVEPGQGGGIGPTITEVSGFKGLDGKILAAGLYPAPWDLYEELTVEVREGLVLVADKAQGDEVKRDVDVLAQAAKDDLDTWKKSGPPPAAGRETARGFFVVLEKRREVYNKLFRGEGRENDSLEAGVNMPVPAREPKNSKDKVSAGSRIVLDTSLSRFTSPEWKDGVTDIGRHEMGHAIVELLGTEQVLVEGVQSTQMWVIEGFAEYMAWRGRDEFTRGRAQAALQGFRFDGTLPESLTFYAKDPKERSAHYVLGGLAVRYIAQKYGENKALAFVAAHYAAPKQYQQQITEATGLPFKQFQSEWAAWVRSQVPGIK
ncbi:hypothetical protein ACWEQL_39010 [Kitasatospora sp. NPDC004240]